MIRSAALIAVLSALAACAIPEPATRIAQSPTALPPACAFGPAPAPVTTRSNASIYGDIQRLVFYLESGRPLQTFTRFEGPVTVRLTGRPGPDTVSGDLDRLLARFRDEAGIDISRSTADRPANINVELVERRRLRRAVPGAACFVVPNVTDWRDFNARRHRPELHWTSLTERRTMAVFIPAEVSSQEIRDCLHEEIAQALGPVNDLYDLRDSVFNDDNFNTVLTGFDMVVLRAIYDPAMTNGMDRRAFAARLPAVLARVNPGGQGRRAEPARGATPGEWTRAIESALGAGTRNRNRLAEAERAVAIARASGWRDNRMGFSLYAYGRLVLPVDPRIALQALAEARINFGSHPATAVHAAHVDVHLAAHALARGRSDDALRIANGALPVARAAQNAALLSTLMMVRSVALDQLGRESEAQATRLDALAWAGYAFRDQTDIRRRMAEVASLPPDPGEVGS